MGRLIVVFVAFNPFNPLGFLDFLGALDLLGLLDFLGALDFFRHFGFFGKFMAFPGFRLFRVLHFLIRAPGSGVGVLRLRLLGRFLASAAAPGGVVPLSGRLVYVVSRVRLGFHLASVECAPFAYGIDDGPLARAGRRLFAPGLGIDQETLAADVESRLVGMTNSPWMTTRSAGMVRSSRPKRVTSIRPCA